MNLRPYQQSAHDAMNILTKEYLSSIIDYDQLTGIFKWKTRIVKTKHDKMFNSFFAGKCAGTKAKNIRSKTSYIKIKIYGKTYKAHRLAFIIMTGDCPDEVDHIDHDGTNNKWENLRRSNSFDNSKNLPIQSSNKSGCIGVNWHNAAKKWQVRAVNKQGKRIDLGRFDDIEHAVNVRKQYEAEFGYYQYRDDINNES